MGGYSIHGESITDGDASSGITFILYESGGVTVRELISTEVLYITDLQVFCETGGDVWVVADTKAAGRYVTHASLDAKGGIILHFNKPYACPKGKVPKLFGAASNLNIGLIEGFIKEA